MKTKVEFTGIVIIDVDGRKYMCGTTADRRFAHNYTPEGKKHEVMCVHTTAEECYGHEQALSIFAKRHL